ncbi:hypothetical protein ACQEXU_03755 [Vibrio sp. TRT 21S02]|uniref:hypothetical protein n=1 Tax=unclassified Vibrio TaxID=2614977 RepID=UPI003CEBC3B9
MNRKLGRVMSLSRMLSFVAFLTATFAWVLEMPVLLYAAVTCLAISGGIYMVEKRKVHQDEKSA